MLEISNNNILQMDDILKLEFQSVVDFLLIKKQQKDLEYYTNAKPNIENKRTTI
jgi:hypothetical protein